MSKKLEKKERVKQSQILTTKGGLKLSFVKKANMWLVSDITIDTKQHQKMNWFESEEEAKEFINLGGRR